MPFFEFVPCILLYPSLANAMKRVRLIYAVSYREGGCARYELGGMECWYVGGSFSICNMFIRNCDDWAYLNFIQNTVKL
jgi:phage FluMu gp28-like protein